MNGYLKPVMDRAYAEIWLPLSQHEACPENIFGQIYRALVPSIRKPRDSFVHESDGSIRNSAPNLMELAATAESDDVFAESLLADLSESSFESEAKARTGLTRVLEVLSEIGSHDLQSNYVSLLDSFVTKYSLPYYVDSNATLWISFPGLASILFEQIKLSTSSQHHLNKQMVAFEHALAECLHDPMESRIATAIQKQCNLLEAIGSDLVQDVDSSFGTIVDKVGTWPHDSLGDAAKRLYKFASNYPGIRHGGTESSANRELDLRDASAFALTFVGMTAYLVQDIAQQVNDVVQGALDQSDGIGGASAPWSRDGAGK